MKRPSSPFSASAYVTQNGNAPVKSGEYERTDFRYDPRRRDYLAIEAQVIDALRQGPSTIPEMKRTLRPANLNHFMDALAKVAHRTERFPLDVFTLNESKPVGNAPWNGKGKEIVL